MTHESSSCSRWRATSAQRTPTKPKVEWPKSSLWTLHQWRHATYEGDKRGLELEELLCQRRPSDCLSSAGCPGRLSLKCLSHLCFRINQVLYSSSQSHTRVSEEQSGEGPSTSSACSVPSSGTAFSSRDPKKPPVKKITPLMAKCIKDFKKRFSRR
ncbi:uncharacterized protein J5M81_013310 isoform 1-T1 [Pluvialis apricaria]